MRRISLLLAASLSLACDQEYPNPFVSPDATATPPPAAELIVTSDAHAETGGSPRDVYALEIAGARLTRLTACNDGESICDNVEAALAPDRLRMVVRRVAVDGNGDGRLTEEDGVALLFVSLERAVEGVLRPPSTRVSGIDWSPLADPSQELLVYTAIGEGGVEDLYRANVDGSEEVNLTTSPGIRERRPRLDALSRFAVFERIDSTLKSEVWLFRSRTDQQRITSGAPEPGLETLPGTPYRVGGDADPSLSPDAGAVVFRRLTAVGNGGLGAWDVLTVDLDGSDERVIVSGAAFRGAPDWGSRGIVFEEIDPDSGAASLVLVRPDGSGRQVLASLGGRKRLSFPRWLR